MLSDSKLSCRDDSQVSPWKALHAQLLSRVKLWVFQAHVDSWKGQEELIAEDIVQEALFRTFQYSQIKDIQSPEKFSRTVAKNYFKDLLRKAPRSICFTLLDEAGTMPEASFEYKMCDTLDPEEIAIDNALHEKLFNELTSIIVALPKKQRAALLADLADNMVFDTQPTTLQSALLKAGIQIQNYVCPPSEDPKERSRFASLRCLAYARLKQSHLQVEYVSVA